jgi:uncharacterized phiE125 gp8 family phage protein
MIKSFLKVDGNDDNDLLKILIEAARNKVEANLGRSLITQTWKLTLDEFPETNYIELSLPPLISVTTVTSYASDDSGTVYSSDNYYVDVPGSRIYLNDGQVWPQATRPHNKAEIIYVTGYGAAATNVPGALRSAILMLVAHWYENREAVSLGDISTEVKVGYDALLQPYKILSILI